MIIFCGRMLCWYEVPDMKEQYETGVIVLILCFTRYVCKPGFFFFVPVFLGDPSLIRVVTYYHVGSTSISYVQDRGGWLWSRFCVHGLGLQT